MIFKEFIGIKFIFFRVEIKYLLLFIQQKQKYVNSNNIFINFLIHKEIKANLLYVLLNLIVILVKANVVTIIKYLMKILMVTKCFQK